MKATFKALFISLEFTDGNDHPIFGSSIDGFSSLNPPFFSPTKVT
jgi:hypothetical protein